MSIALLLVLHPHSSSAFVFGNCSTQVGYEHHLKVYRCSLSQLDYLLWHVSDFKVILYVAIIIFFTINPMDLYRPFIAPFFSPCFPYPEMWLWIKHHHVISSLSLGIVFLDRKIFRTVLSTGSSSSVP